MALNVSAYYKSLLFNHSDSSDDEKEKPPLLVEKSTVENVESQNDCVQPSDRLNIVNNSASINKKFSIWSDVLLEEELCESMGESVKLKKRKRRKKEKDSENYSFWTKEDFERKFSSKKTVQVKKRLRMQNVKNDLAAEISRKLNEPRVDIIKRVINALGDEKARKLTSDVINIEASGGLMTNNNSRRRSPGGVLFFLVKSDPSLSDQQKQDIFNIKFSNVADKRMKRSSKPPNGPRRNKSKKKNKKKKSKTSK